MSGETKQSVSGWSIDTLKEHLEALILAADTRYEQRFLAQEKAVREALAAQEKAVTAALTAAEKAVAVAERNAEEWRKGANEWRGSMTDREQNFASRPEMASLKERIDKAEGSGRGMKDTWGWIIAAIAVIAAVAAVAVALIK